MSDAAVAAKSAKTAKIADVAPAPAKTGQYLRQVQDKKFGPSALQEMGFGDNQILAATAPRDMSFSEAMKPIAWSGVAVKVARDSGRTRNEKDGKGIVIVLNTDDDRYLAFLRIESVARNKQDNPIGLNVVCIGPSIDIKTGESMPIDLKTRKAWVDPVKVED